MQIELTEEQVRAIREADAQEPTFPLSNRFTEGERIVIPGMEGSYPDHNKNQWGYVTEIKREVVTLIRETLVVHLDTDEEPRGINPDIVAHGDDWRYVERDPQRGR